MGVEPRMTESLGESFHLVRLEAVLAPVGLLVPGELGEAGLLGEVLLPEPVDADHAQRVASPRVREFQARLRRARRAVCFEVGEDVGCPACRDRQCPREALGRRDAPLVLPVVEMLEGVLRERAPAQEAPARPAREEAAPRPEAEREQEAQGAGPGETDEGIDHGGGTDACAPG
jgi:hypothetical protein